jgi:hypothetical protein
MNMILREAKMSLPHVEPDALRDEMSSLFSVLTQLIDEQGSIVLHVTAARQGEGTTTVTRGLAAVAACSKWCNVALIDGHRPLGAGIRSAGILAGMSAGPGELPDIPSRGLLETLHENGDQKLRRLHIGDAELAVGSLSAGGCGVQNVESVRELYTRLRSRYTLVLVDCPPVMVSRETAVLASIADGTILVLEAERTRVAEVKRARERLEQLGATILGVVFNKHRRRTPSFIERLT